MHQEINKSGHQQSLCIRNRPEKSPMRTLKSIFYGKVYQFALMKENFHRGAHALAGLSFAPWVIVFS